MLAVVRVWGDRLISLSTTIGSLGLILITLVILVDVVGRVFKHPIFGSQDLITMTMVIVVFGGMAICDRQGGHVAVDLLERYLPSKLNYFLDIFTALLGCIIFLGLAYTVYESAKISIMLNLSTNLLRLPKVWFQGALSVLAIVTALGMLLRAIELIGSKFDVRKGQSQ